MNYYNADARSALVCQVFAPTTIRMTFESDGIGKFKPEEIEQIVIRDPSGKIVELRLPSRLVIIGNHQVRTVHSILITNMI